VQSCPVVRQVPKPVRVQALVSKPAVEALHVAVLGWLSRLNVNQLDFPFFTPAQEMSAGQFWPVIAPDTLRSAAAFNDLFERARHALARETCVYFQRHAFARKGVHDRQYPNPSARG
jgi:hypothetical protein